MFGPTDLGNWGPNATFAWESDPLYSQPDRFLFALSSLEDFRRDTGIDTPIYGQLIAWLDTLTYYPDFEGGYFTDSLVWRSTQLDSASFVGLPATGADGKYLFAVRGIGHGGTEVLERQRNFRAFSVLPVPSGARLCLVSNLAGTWSSSSPAAPPRDVFRGAGLRFEWESIPGPSGQPVTGFGYAIDDSSLWSPYSNVQAWPPGDDLWLPTVGIHTFFVRVIDAAGSVRVLAADLNVLAGPQECADGRILVVLDSDPDALVSEGFLPVDYEAVERALVDEWFTGYTYEVFETSGMVPPPNALLDCATSLFWFHSTLAGSDPSILKTFHAESPNPLQSYVAAAGNLFVCGFQPSFALRYFESRCGEVTYMSNYPLPFSFSLTDPTLVPHWAALRLGVGRIDGTVGNTYGPGSASDRLSVAMSAVTGGATPYPDLPFDPMTWPDGPAQGGFGFYDRDFVAMPGAEVVYEQNATGRPIGLRRSASPGVNGNVVVLGFHPYFVERPAFRALLESVLSDFGEAPPR